MSRWDILCFCVGISNKYCIPLEELWFDNQLTFLGALIFTFIIDDFLDKFLTNIKKV